MSERSLSRMLTFVCFVSCVAYSGKADIGFRPTSISGEPNLGAIEGTFGWAFNRSPSLSLDQQVAITAIGVFDDGGDGLMNSHAVGIWDGFGTLLASGTVPAGTEAPLVEGYRYVSLQPVILSPTAGGRAGAFFSLNDPDGVRRPNGGTIAPEMIFPTPAYGLFNDAPTLGFPWRGISRNMEGEPNYAFYPVNFQFEIVPEPSTVAVFALALAGWLLLRRRANRE